jgi:uncharacterized GH25 family protein
MNKIIAFGFALLLVAVPTMAHDFWIEPSTHAASVNQTVSLTLRVGENFSGDTVPRMKSHLKTFSARQGSEVTAVMGKTNATPAGTTSFAKSGAAVIVYESNPRVVEMKKKTFKHYVAEEGLEARVAGLGLANKATVRDAYSRYAKTIVAVDSDELVDREIGMEFELVGVGDLRAASQKGAVPLRVLFRGKPVSGTLVIAVNKQNPSQTIRGRSDDRGHVALRLDRKGAWLIKAVHLIPASDKTTADIESFWASLTMEL